MKKINPENFTKKIHFPITRAIYKKPPKRTWFQKLFKFFVYRRSFEMMEDYVLWVPCLNSFIFIPKRFVSDLASVPKVLNGIYNTNGMLLLGAWPHDFGYKYESLFLVDEKTGELTVKSFSKKELDNIFKSLCAWESGFKGAAAVAKEGLSLFGFTGWNENRKANHVLTEDFKEVFG